MASDQSVVATTGDLNVERACKAFLRAARLSDCGK